MYWGPRESCVFFTWTLVKSSIWFPIALQQAYQLDELAKRGIENQLDYQGEKIVMSSAKWWIFNSDIPQGWILVLVGFALLIDSLADGESESLSMIQNWGREGLLSFYDLEASKENQGAAGV